MVLCKSLDQAIVGRVNKLGVVVFWYVMFDVKKLIWSVINKIGVSFLYGIKVFGNSVSDGWMVINLLLFCVRGLLMLTSEHWYQMKFFKQSLSGNWVIYR